MKPPVPAIVSALLILSGGVAHGKTKKLTVPPVFQSAHTVYVESVDGDMSKPGVSDADREAIQEVREAVREWNRYMLAESREKSDLIIVIRKGHAVGDADHLGLGLRPKMPEPPPPPGSNAPLHVPGSNTQDASAAMGGDDIADQDLLRVYTPSPKGKLKRPVWSREMDQGLSGPELRLFRELKAAVEITYPSEPAQQPTQ